jgi:hypothetical protein
MPKTTTRRARSKPATRTARAGKSPPTLAGRLRSVTGPMTFREIGKLTLTHPENARRYMQGMAVSLGFFKNFCRAFNVSADWLLEGRGSMQRR